MSSSLSSSAATSSPATNQSDSNSPQNLRTISSAHFPQTSPPPSSFRTTSHSSPNCSLVSPNPTPTDCIFEANQTLTQVHEELRKWEKILKNIQAVLDDAEEKQMKDRHVKIWLAELQDLAYDMDDILDEFGTEALGSKPKRKIERPPTTSLVNEAPVYGREEDKKAIIDLLLMNDYSDDKVIVIPIVGIGGIGKTTLAQLVYNDDSIKDHFDIKVWVELKEKLYENNFLLVLDDIWNGRYHDWNILQYNGHKMFETLYEAEQLRTFLVFMLPILTNNVLLDLLPKLRHLKVLSLESLPESICTLFKLQTLLLRGCDHLKQLPSNLRFLSNLQGVDIIDTNSIKGMPFGIGELIDLQALTNFVVGQGVGYQIRELNNLSNLKGQLSLSRLENLVNAQDALEARLFDKSNLDDLEMKWSADLKDDLRKEGVEKEVLSLLQPHKKLKKLIIKYYGGLAFPTWVGDPSFKNLIFLNFEGCQKCTSLPSIGKLPFLKVVCIKGMSFINRVDAEFYGEKCSNAFPSLEILHFEDMPELKEWNFYQVDGQTRFFKCLRDLSVKKCPKLLRSQPSCLPCL
ncbi:PREDICTED: putative disease resistance RPP13-like protein 1 [Theobroma cacao]|uniref:Disease resistance RPP13-like protein 1 n=1 Tax=Theobroma cacao TaxID=3641 RepID=A0AB32X0V6_THECC|nr:PREDICTED: putative disease resistance RPP13-like protein 1 [Theobroma cacao]